MKEITSRKNPLIQHLKKLGSDRVYRDACGAFLCDGRKLYEEALQSGIVVTLAATSQREIAESLTCETILVPTDVLENISPMRTPQPLLFACQKPDGEPMSGAERLLILDGLQDPGNVGTLLRSASAFGIDQVILIGNSVDLYNPKTVRAAMGALFRQRVCTMTLDELMAYVNENGLTLLGADAAASGADVRDTLPSCLAIAIGNEGQGLSGELRARCHGTVRIPMEDIAESLNAGVAGSILLWELYRRSI